MGIKSLHYVTSTLIKNTFKIIPRNAVAMAEKNSIIFSKNNNNSLNLAE